MSDINNFTLPGRLIRDPEVRFAPTGTAVAPFAFAANHHYQNRGGQWKDEAAYVPCSAFGCTAEQLAQKHRGDPVLATGRLRTETWEQDGANPSRLVLIAESVHFILPASKPNGAGPNGAVTPDPAEAREAVLF
jgi:single-strand DNA-binding protein